MYRYVDGVHKTYEIKLFEDAFNNVIGRDSGWLEEYSIPPVDIEDKFRRAQTEDILIKNDTLVPNEVREGYGRDPLPYGDTPYTTLFGGGSAPPNPTAAGIQRWLEEKNILRAKL